MKSVRIVRIDPSGAGPVEDLLTEEIALQVLTPEQRLVTIACSPADLEELVLGFLFTSGLIEGAGDLLSVVVNRATWTAFVKLARPVEGSRLPLLNREILPGCGGGPEEGRGEETPAGAAEPPGRIAPASEKPFAAALLSALVRELTRRSELHRSTGGVHGAALADRDGILVFREDIGRHNAIDKVIGHQLAAGGSFAGKVLLSSGRLTSEVVRKACRAGVPVVVSPGAPTDRSVALARQAGLTLVGFARGKRMNLYSAPERVAPDGGAE